MNKNTFWCVCFSVAILFLFPELAFANGAFESKMSNLNSKLTSVVLPLVSICGLVYAAILGMSGSGEAKSRMIMVIVASTIGFLAGPIIRFVQSIMGF